MNGKEIKREGEKEQDMNLSVGRICSRMVISVIVLIQNERITEKEIWNLLNKLDF